MNNFEDNLKKLETLSADIKRTDISLEDALKDFEEGIKLVKGMEKELDQIEAKIQILVKDPDSLTEDENLSEEKSSGEKTKSSAKNEKSLEKKSAEKSAKQNDFEGALDLFAPETQVNGTRS